MALSSAVLLQCSRRGYSSSVNDQWEWCNDGLSLSLTLMDRYSAKVDSYIPNIAACLRDESVLIRRQTLTLLTNLFQEDYIKWKGGLFFRFAVTLVDEDTELQRYGGWVWGWWSAVECEVGRWSAVECEEGRWSVVGCDGGCGCRFAEVRWVNVDVDCMVEGYVTMVYLRMYI